MSTIASQINLRIGATLESARGIVGGTGIVKASAPLSWVFSETFTSASHTPTKLYCTETTITASSDVYDLSGTLEDPIGDVVSFSTVYAVALDNEATHKMYLGGVTNGFPLTSAAATAQIYVPAGGTYVGVFPTGISVSNGSTDVLKVWGTTGDQYSLIVLGK